MGLIPRLTKADIRRAFAKQRKALHDAIVLNLAYLGELVVNHARSVRSYQDQTGNLRNSIGYIIVHNGRIVQSNFQRAASVKVTTDKGRIRTTKGSADGVTAGRELAKQKAGEITRGYGLIVVCGMDYALAVESRGLDVLSSAEALAETELPRMIAQLKADVKNLATQR